MLLQARTKKAMRKWGTLGGRKLHRQKGISNKEEELLG